MVLFYGQYSNEKNGYNIVTESNNKIYLSYQDIHIAVQRSAERIIASDFMPDFILAIGSGGLIPARILRTFLK